MDKQILDDINDSRLQDFLSLRDGSKNNPGIFVVDGANLFIKAMKSGAKLKSVLIEQGRSFAELLPPGFDFDLFEISRSLLRTVPGYGHHQGIIAIFYIPDFEENMENLRFPALVLEELTNSENMGVIMRTAAAFGVQSIILSSGCSRPFLRRSVRVSMGGVFGLRFYQSSYLLKDLQSLKNKGVTVFCLEQSENAINLKQSKAHSEKFVLVLGSEGAGMSAGMLELADYILEIRHSGAVDSLNVAQSCTLGLYHLLNI